MAASTPYPQDLRSLPQTHPPQNRRQKPQKKKGKEENPPSLPTLTERSVHSGSIVVLTAVDAHTIAALIVGYLD